MSEVTGQQAEVTPTLEEIQAKHHEAIQESKKYRTRAQAVEAELETLKAEREAERASLLAEQGKYKELYETLLPEHESAKEKAAKYETWVESHRQNLIEKLPEEKRVLVDDLPLDKLEKFVELETPTGGGRNEPPPGARKGVGKPTLAQIREWMADPALKRDHWTEIQEFYSNE